MSTTPGTDIAEWSPSEWANIGMEDVGAGDLVIPRLSIMHKEGKFLNNQSKEEFTSLKCVMFGLVKQRIMWDSDVQDGDKPQCKSPDHDHGYPQMRKDIEKRLQFPWDISNFNEADFPPVDGQVTLSCTSCAFNQWTKDPRTGKSVAPLCSEQHTYPLAYTVDEGETWTTAIVTFQRTGIKPSKTYLSVFNQSRMPMFTAYTDLSLQTQSRGNVEFSVPVFKKGDPTPRENWREWADAYIAIREFLRTPPRRQGEDEDQPTTVSDNTNTAPTPTVVAASPAPAPAPAPPAPAAEAPASQPAADDDLPF